MLEKVYTFKNFSDALSFVNDVGEVAEDMAHHPDIHIYQYSHVRLTSITHDVGRVTDKDRELIARADIAFSQY